MAMRRTIIFGVCLFGSMALPVTGIGQPTISHGGPPSDVFTNTQSADVCNGDDPVRRGAVGMLPTQISLGAQAHVVATFTSTLSRKRFTGAEAVLLLQMSKPGLFARSPMWIQRVEPGHETVTVMWTFEDMPAGDYRVRLFGSVPGLSMDEPGVNFQSCALTALVTPVAV
jgi:hypothetical protein